jgi:predicted nucleic acid-binding protein
VIAVDTSSWIAFLQGDAGKDTELLDRALQDRQVLMVPVVLTEVLSDPKLSAEVAQTLSELPQIEIGLGYWQRAGELRARVLTRDRDFQAFAEAAGLDLLIVSTAD